MLIIPKSLDNIQETPHNIVHISQPQQNATLNTTTQTTLLQRSQTKWHQLFNYTSDPIKYARGLFIMKQNLQTNYNWGDFLTNKTKNTIQIYTQNIN